MTMIRGPCRALAAIAFAGSMLAPGAASAAPITLIASGFAPGDIQAQVDAFRAEIGDPNNANNPGPLAGGRREINWDGGGSLDTAVAGTPFTGFQDIRGATFTTPGTGFVQAPLDGLATQFANPGYATNFQFFSPARVFTPIDSNVTDVTFSIPGTAGATAATVSAFGAVFSDVELSGATTMEFFTPEDASLGVFDVPSLTGSATLSFLGVLFDAGEQIARVRITTGNLPLGPNGNDLLPEVDVVVMDDFIYAEPVAIPEPGKLALIALGLAAAGAARRRQERSGR
jgi:hypothetical protein